MRNKAFIKVLAAVLAMVLTFNTVAPAAAEVYATETETEETVGDDTSETLEDSEDVSEDEVTEETPEESEDAAEGEGTEETPDESEDAAEGEGTEEIPEESEDAAEGEDTATEEVVTEEEVVQEDETVEEVVTVADVDELQELTTSDYKTFLARLKVLEDYASEYASTHEGEDALELVINYIRTGVERYRDGSWTITAGEEKTEFVRYVEQQDGAKGTEARGLRNLENFELPNRDYVDFGHMFGCMNITYYIAKTNPTAASIYADLSGWGGDLTDLMEEVVNLVPVDEVEVMTADIFENYFAVEENENSGFDIVDVYGDLDGYYIMTNLEGGKSISKIMENYFNMNLTEESRALYFIKNRFGSAVTKEDLRNSVYNTYASNGMLKNLETSKGLTGDISNLRFACCCAFADWLFERTGIVSEKDSNEYYEVFKTETYKLAPGIVQKNNYAMTTADGKQIVFHLATADITRNDVDIYANYANNDGSVWQMERVMDQMLAAEAKHTNPDDPENYVPNYTAVVGVNGDFFNMSTGQPTGALVMEGVKYQDARSELFFAILNDGTPVIGSPSEWNNYKENVKEAVGGNAWLVKNGKIVVKADEDYYSSRASRTCVGITADNKVVVMVLNGRQEPYSVGGSMIELAYIMKEAGCVQAMNLDGGGSTTFVAKQEGSDELSVINSPSDGFARSVSSSLVIVSTAKPSTEFDHALVLSDYDYMTVGTSTEIVVKGVNISGGAAELPEGAYLRVTDETVGTLKNGVFTANKNGDVEVQLIANDVVVGKKALHVVIPEEIAFEKEHVNAIYGEELTVPVRATYKGNAVAINEDDVYLLLDNDAAGTISGLSFTPAEKTSLRSVKVKAYLAANEEVTATLKINLYHQDEASFDFDDATGGDREFSWKREVTNTNSTDLENYYIVDMDKEIEMSYIFGIDMKEIEIPEKLLPLVSYLPGGDNVEATAWDFLCQLAERISIRTNVKVEVQLDKNFDVDYSELTVVNDYFELAGQEFDEENNKLTISFNWIDQTKAIDPNIANSICILSGIKLTPKTGTDDVLEPVNCGAVSYDIYLRANALYSMSLDEEFQEIYGVYPFEHKDILYEGSPEKGGCLSSIFVEFEDKIKLDRTGKEGWLKEANGNLYYYVDNVKLTGIHEVPGYLDEGNKYYYEFNEEGISQGKISDIFELDGNMYYAINGTLQYGWFTLDINGVTNSYYFDPVTKAAADGIQKIGGYTYEFTDHILTKGQLVKVGDKTRYMWAGKYATYQWLNIDGKMSYATANGDFRTGIQNWYTPDGDEYFPLIFDEDGVWLQDMTGMFNASKDKNGNLYIDESSEDTYYAKNGIWVEYPGLVEIDGDYYYFKSDGRLMENNAGFYWISKSSLDFIPADASYEFDNNGKMLNPAVYPMTIVLGEIEITVNAKSTSYKLKATLDSKDNASMIKTVKWTSSNTEVATVASGATSGNVVEGVVKGVNPGTAVITATTANGRTATCTVTVMAPTKAITLSDTAITVARGEKAVLTAMTDPVNTTDTITWKSSDESIVKVSETGELTAVEKGTATITATATSGKSAKCTVTVNVPADKVTLTVTRLSMFKGEFVELTPEISPVDTTDSIEWSSSDEKVATVTEEGKVIATGAGSAVITVKADSGKKAVCRVTVYVPAESISLSTKELIINKGETNTLTATLNPTDSTDTITWTSADETIASVDANGTITAVKAGTVEITATATSGVTETCQVTVNVPAETVCIDNIDETGLTLIKGAEETLTVIITPEDTTEKPMWTTSDETVAIVTEDGKVTAVGAGNAVVTVTVGAVSAEGAVTVEVPAEDVILSDTELVLHGGTTHALTATITPEDATDEVVWTTSDETVATVDENGVVTALDKIGTATITVTVGTVSAECVVLVKKSADSVALDYTELSLQPEEIAELTAIMTPADVEETITWTSSDENVVAVTSNGLKATLTANTFGTATITAITTSGLTATCTVVVEIKSDSIELNKTAVTLYKGEADVLISSMLPADTTDEVTWTTSNETIVTVSEIGEIVALAEGTATITAITTSGKTAVCEVTVIRVPAVAVKLDKTEVKVNRGKTYTLTATLDPVDVTDEIIWTSSNEDVATVDENGVVIAVSGITGGGKAKITATTISGATAECEVTVKDERSTSIKLNKTVLTVNKGKTATLKATLLTAKKNVKTTDTVTWTTSDETIATVDANGKVTAVKPGTVIITAIATSGLRAVCQVTVNSPATAVVLSEKTVSMNSGETYLLSAVMDPEDTTDTLTWSTSKKSVATVAEDGTVTAVAKGSATITVKTTSGKKATCKVTVLLPAESLTLNKTDVTLVKGENLTLKATLEPKGTTDTVTWTTSDEKVVTVDSKGKVTVVGDGEANITVTTTSGLTATCKVTVNDVPAEAVKLNKTAVEVNRGKTYNLKATLAPKTSTDFVAWTSSNEEVATVDANGVVTAVSGITGDGKATITATASSGVTAVCDVKVIDKRATSINLNKTEVTVNKGKTYSLTAKLSSKSTDTVTWTTSDEAIATVDVKGKVVAIAPGTVTITATTTSGLTAACDVTVKSPATKVVISEKTIAMNEGETFTLSAVMETSDTTDTLTWSTSKESVATVAEDGTVTAGVKGTATITVKTTSGKKATCKVTVLRPATELKLLKGKVEVTSIEVNKGKSVTLKADLKPNGTTDKVTWTTRNENIAKVSTSGKVTGVSRGTTILVAETTSGVQAYCLITVNVPATKVIIPNGDGKALKAVTMYVDDTYQLSSVLTPITTTDDTTWTSSKQSVASIDENGTVTAVGVGKATITVKTTSGKTAKCTITVVAGENVN